mgnify:CR=1 FL=1
MVSVSTKYKLRTAYETVLCYFFTEHSSLTRFQTMTGCKPTGIIIIITIITIITIIFSINIVLFTYDPANATVTLLLSLSAWSPWFMLLE